MEIDLLTLHSHRAFTLFVFNLYFYDANYLFNRFFNANVVYRRDLDRYSSFAIIERLLNYKNLYINKEFRELITDYV